MAQTPRILICIFKSDEKQEWHLAKEGEKKYAENSPNENHLNFDIFTAILRINPQTTKY